MSVQTVNQFLQAVGEAPQLQEKLNKALEGGNSPQALINFAAKHGYRFTAEELSAEAQHLQNEFQQRHDVEELNEEELKSVAGGNSAALAGILTVAAAAAVKTALEALTIRKNLNTKGQAAAEALIKKRRT